MSTKETQDKESVTDVDEEETSVSSYASPKDHISVSSGCSELQTLTQANDEDAPALERLTREETPEGDEMVPGGENEDDNNEPNPSPSSSEEIGAKLQRWWRC